MTPRLLYRRAWDAADLARRHPPQWFHRNKVAIHEMLAAALPPPSGRVEVTRWAPAPRAAQLPDVRPAVEVRADYFTYEPDPVAWHVNFADAHLFGGYATGLLAQDELQVVEHPILGSVLEALIAEDLPAMTCEGERPTPVLVRGAERRCAIDLAPDAARGRPHGLYGNAFARTPVAAMLEAVHPVAPATTTHVIAMEAPAYGTGRYALATLRFVIETAVTGFAAARLETPEGDPVVHTGYWGCGVYGGDRELMTQLQVAAARIAGIRQVVFHAGQAPDVATLALAKLTDLPAWKAPGASEKELLAEMWAQGHRWGEGDGN